MRTLPSSSPQEEEKQTHNNQYNDMKSDVSHYASIEVNIENFSDEIADRDPSDMENEDSISTHSVVVHEVPYHKAVPNKWRSSCKRHFDDFWQEYFHALFDEDLSTEYKQKFVALKLDDIRCIPYIHMKHLLNAIHMLKDDAREAFKMINKFNRNRDAFFGWITNKCHCKQYLSNFENAGILTWKTFAKSIVSKSDLNDIIPENQINNNLDRKVIWANIPSDIWDYYEIDRHQTMSQKKPSLHFLFPSAVNLKPDISWHYTPNRETPQKHVERLWIGFITLLFILDVIVAIYIIRNDGIPHFDYLINNISTAIHFIVQLLLILSWMEWLVFVHMNMCMKFMQWVTELLLFATTLILLFNITIYILHSIYETNDNFIGEVAQFESNNMFRNAWFILNGVAFLVIFAFIGFMSIKKICEEEVQHLALMKEGEHNVVTKLEKDAHSCCNAMCSYLSLIVVKYLMLSMLLNTLMFMQSGLYLYWRYVPVSFVTHDQIMRKHEFKIIIFISDIVGVFGGILLTYYLKKQRLNYETIKELNRSERRFNANSAFNSQDLHNLNGIITNPGSPIL